MRKLLRLVAGCCGLILAGCDGSGGQPSRFSHAGLDSVLQKQVLLANDATFSDDKMEERGSAFLMRYEDKIWGVTGIPLAISDSVNNPTVTIKHLRAAFKSWQMYPRGATDPSKHSIQMVLDSTQKSNYKEDALFLRAQVDQTDLAVLKPQFAMPAIDDTLFLIGCPRGEPGCKQKVYPILFEKYHPKLEMMTFFQVTKADLHGFGGAPILNRQGEVVAFLIGGSNFLDVSAINATHIQAIQQALW